MAFAICPSFYPSIQTSEMWLLEAQGDACNTTNLSPRAVASGVRRPRVHLRPARSLSLPVHRKCAVAQRGTEAMSPGGVVYARSF